MDPLAQDPELARVVTQRWFPDLCPDGAKVSVGFEWSPGRREPDWLNDRTAFDAVIFIATPSARHLIGIETKYHEHPVAGLPNRVNPKTKSEEPRTPNPRYLEVNGESGLCGTDTVMSQLWGTTLEQIWRDHLLALACHQHPTQGWDQVRYVLVAPSENPSWSQLANQYLKVVPAATATFEFRTIEQLLDAAHSLLPQEAAFRSRYLDLIV